MSRSRRPSEPRQPVVQEGGGCRCALLIPCGGEPAEDSSEAALLEGVVHFLRPGFRCPKSASGRELAVSAEWRLVQVSSFLLQSGGEATLPCLAVSVFADVFKCGEGGRRQRWLGAQDKGVLLANCMMR